MATTTRWTVNNSGEILQTWLDRAVLDNLYPNLYFYKMGKKPLMPNGYNTLSFTRPQKLDSTTANAVLTEGVTPTDENLTFDTVNVTPKQYGKYITVSDLLKAANPVDIIGSAATELWQAMASIIDNAIQDTLALWTNVIYAGDATDRSSIDASDTLAAKNLAEVSTKLSANNAKPVDAWYVAVIHPNVYHSLKTDTSSIWFIEASKYATPDKIFKGEVWSLFGVRVVVSSNIKTFSSTVEVYPTYVFGADAYGVAELQGLTTYITGWTASDSDPLSQRVKVGAKISFGSVILTEDALVRIESASGI